MSSPRVVVERDDGRAAPHRGERVPAAAAAHVEQRCPVRTSSRSKSTVSTTGVRRRVLVEQRAVVLDHAVGGGAPREPSSTRFAAGCADAGPQLGVAERAGSSIARERVGIAGRHERPLSPSVPDDLGQRAAGGGDERHAARHRLDRRQREALVQRRDDRDLGFGVQLDDALGGHARHELDRVLRARAGR